MSSGVSYRSAAVVVLLQQSHREMLVDGKGLQRYRAEGEVQVSGAQTGALGGGGGGGGSGSVAIRSSRPWS